IGTAGVPGAGLIGMSIVFTQAGLPIEIVALTAGINILVDMIFTFGNVVGDLVGAKIVDQTEKKSNFGNLTDANLGHQNEMQKVIAIE
ncbi:cation:dicarboxylate symporter family transporter, partial [Psychrobacter sp.]